MFRSMQFRFGACALAGLLASAGVAAMPFHLIVDGEAEIDGDTDGAANISFIELLVQPQPDRRVAGPLALQLGARDSILGGLPFDSGFAFAESVPGPHARGIPGSFVGGVITMHAVPIRAQTPVQAPNAVPRPAAEAGGASIFAEPASVALLGLGLAGLAYSSYRRRRRRSRSGA